MLHTFSLQKEPILRRSPFPKEREQGRMQTCCWLVWCSRTLSCDAVNCTQELGLIHSDNYWAALILLVFAAFLFVLQNRKIGKPKDM